MVGGSANYGRIMVGGSTNGGGSANGLKTDILVRGAAAGAMAGGGNQSCQWLPVQEYSTLLLSPHPVVYSALLCEKLEVQNAVS